MPPFRSALLVTLLIAISTGVHATVYKCVDGQGRTTYTNTPAGEHDCAPLRGDIPFSAIAAPDSHTQNTPSQSKTPASSTGISTIAPQAQHERDTQRLQILREELERERTALQAARETLQAETERDAPEDRNVVRQRADGSTYRPINLQKREQRLQPHRDQVKHHERNIEALEKEISDLQ